MNWLIKCVFVVYVWGVGWCVFVTSGCVLMCVCVWYVCGVCMWCVCGVFVCVCLCVSTSDSDTLGRCGCWKLTMFRKVLEHHWVFLTGGDKGGCCVELHHLFRFLSLHNQPSTSTQHLHNQPSISTQHLHNQPSTSTQHLHNQLSTSMLSTQAGVLTVLLGGNVPEFSAQHHASRPPRADVTSPREVQSVCWLSVCRCDRSEEHTSELQSR